MSEPTPEIDPRLARALQQLRKSPSRSPEAAARGRAAFLARGQALRNEKASRVAMRHNLWVWFMAPRRLAAAVIALFLVLVLAGGGATVYAAQDSLPDSPLYTVKTWTEDIQVAFVAEPQAKLDLVLELTDRRVGEILTLNARQVVPPTAVSNRLQSEIQQALELSVQLPPEVRGTALAHIQTHVEKQRQKLEEVQNRVAGPAKPALENVQDSLEERLDQIDAGVKDPGNFKPASREKATPPGSSRHGIETPTGLVPAVILTPSSGIQTQEPSVNPTATPAPDSPGQNQHPTVQSPGQGQPPLTPPGQNNRPGDPPGKSDHSTNSSSQGPGEDDKSEKDRNNPVNKGR